MGVDAPELPEAKPVVSMPRPTQAPELGVAWDANAAQEGAEESEVVPGVKVAAEWPEPATFEMPADGPSHRPMILSWRPRLRRGRQLSP